MAFPAGIRTGVFLTPNTAAEEDCSVAVEGGVGMLDEAILAAFPVCSAPKTESVKNSTEVRLWIWSEIESWPSFAAAVSAVVAAGLGEDGTVEGFSVTESCLSLCLNDGSLMLDL